MSTQPKAAPGAEFLRALAAAALRDGDPAELAARAARALDGVFQRQKSLVLDVQFTGFLFKGKPLGGVDPVLLRAAGQLIVQRITRVGFTPEAGEDDLRTFFAGLAQPAGALGEAGIAGWLDRKRPHGIYLSTTTGVYRPPARPRPAPPEAAQTVAEDAAPAAPPSPPTAVAESGTQADAGSVTDTPSSTDAAPRTERVTGETKETSGAPQGGEAPAPVFAAGGFMLFEEGEPTELSDFELIDEFPVLPHAPAARSTEPSPGAASGEDAVAANDMFHFFRTAGSERTDAEVEKLPAQLHAADNPSRFDDLAEAASRAAQRLVRAGEFAQAIALLDALVREAERPDRTRIFRDSALQALRRVGTSDTLQHFGDLLQQAGSDDRERILHLFSFLGGEAVPLMETLLFRTADPELRAALFRRLMRVDGIAGRIAARAMGDPSPARTRVILELAALPDVDAETATRWLADAAQHADTTVRMDVARHAAVVGGRGGLRILLDLLGDRDPLVRRAAAQSLGTLGDASAVPFLVRLAGDGADEEVQVAAITSLGRLNSAEPVPALMGIVGKRTTLFGTRKLTRAKAAAIAALARIQAPAAREAIFSLASGKDPEVAAEAQRVLATID